MPAKLHAQFMAFHKAIALDKAAKSLEDKREILQDDIEKNLPKELDKIGLHITKSDMHFFDQGSYRQKTSTGIESPNPDRDVAVEFPIDIKKFDDPRKIKQCVRDALKIENCREPRIKEPCITVAYLREGEENTHIDFPVYAIDQEQRYLARGKENGKSFDWELCDPHGLNDYLDNLFSGDEGNQFRRVVRYLKKWKLENYSASCSKDQMPPSIALTLIAGDKFIYQQTDEQDDDMNALSRVVDGVMSLFNYDVVSAQHTISYKLPVEPKSNVFYKMTPNSQNEFYEKWVKLSIGLHNAIKASEDYEAAKILQKILGEDFPLPPKPVAKTGAARKEYSYA